MQITPKRISLNEEELALIFNKYRVTNYRDLAKALGMDVSALYKQLNGQRNISDQLYRIIKEIF